MIAALENDGDAFGESIRRNDFKAFKRDLEETTSLNIVLGENIIQKRINFFVAIFNVKWANLLDS